MGLLALAGCAEPSAFSDEAAPAALIVPALTPPVAVAKIEGAPHDWEIHERVAKALRAHDIPASTGGVERTAYVLRGELIQSPAPNGEIDVRVTWRLFDAQQRQVAETSHRATLARALIAQSAAEVADGLARVTAERLAPLLPSGIARAEPATDAAPPPRRLERPPESESMLQFQRAEAPNTRSDVEIDGKHPARAARQHYWVQIGSHKDEAQSRAEWPKLQAVAGDALRSAQHRIHRADLGTRGIFYRLQVGPYGAAEAATLCAQLKARNLDCFLAIEQAGAKPEPARPEPPAPAPVAKPAPAAKPETVATPAPPKPEAKSAPAPTAKTEPKPEPATAPAAPKNEPKPETKPAPAEAKPAERPRLAGVKPPVFKRPEMQPPTASSGEPLLPKEPSAVRDEAPTSTAPGLPGVID